ncbi:bifunctional proline dehydrogenase/L-glutamate gamma-semialdehyde dehydrogenase [Brevibacterium sp. UMB1308A]|uniref:bifunctional proline dehydrogenase/L-glutamate gamma-semialdehyde dehydrogenase n=1 Tax=Brevibacterium sp. UMB1308A TaxID=3050608 RepID=UPI00254F9F22|nr:bifunctional proline dehydrogenase/L-glutamate gamma-semialdehyde dehydrogenase [Brevibacterium sp. UMB1308A]MDK8346760.1 bifunctional proline dehydrogenase/L-glutamate gamma-semialdehyde dehydrogenase [Brevibacterium sp. UMB1308B]MDK8714100.1 bifunctional proline dehydrogenase/L-glutamate gamma-semialdehyde dehydrogenase [Brevibacterium sp. UMB1308A]
MPRDPQQVPIDHANSELSEPTNTDLDALANKAVDRVRRWLRLSTAKPAKSGWLAPKSTNAANSGSPRWSSPQNASTQALKQEQRLAAVLSDPNGLPFTSGFVDRVIRIEDTKAAARALTEVARLTPESMSLADRAQIQAGAALATAMPDLVIPAARARLRNMVGHMVVDARPEQFGKTVATLKRGGHRLNINLLGEAVLGEEEADNHLEQTHDLLARDDVDYVSIKVSSVASRINMWSYDETVTYVVDRLRPLYRQAMEQAGSEEEAARGAKFINLDMEEYNDLNLTIDVFMRLLSEEEFHQLSAGIVIQAYLPDALPAIQRLSEFARSRVEAGGAEIKVRLVKGANLAMERVHAELANWPLTVNPTKQATDANYKRILHWTLTPENTAGLRLGVAGHNLFDIAFAHELSVACGLTDRVEFEMLQGMATKQAEVISADVGDLLLYVPAVHPDQFDAAVSYLVRRLEENTSPQNFMASIFEIANGSPAFQKEEERFRASVNDLGELLAAGEPPTPNRKQDRGKEAKAGRGAAGSPASFRNEPDTDISLPANQAWVREFMEKSSAPGWLEDQPQAEPFISVEDVNRCVETARDQHEWRSLSAAERLEVLDRAADIFAAKRGQFLSVMAHEAGKTLAQSDPEVSEAIDFIRYYARQACELERIQERDGVHFEPDRVVIVTPPWNFPVAIPTGGAVAALAVGASAILKPAGAVARCGALIAECLWEAGVPKSALQLAPSLEGDLGRALIGHKAVDRVILTGASETAELFKSFRSGLQVNAETSGKNAIVITPSADRDLAVADLVYSAFGHAGQKCSASSLGIMVGSVYESERYRKQLVDAAQSLVVDVPTNLRAEMGPLTVDASEKLLRALTQLEEGEEWLVEPRQLDDSGRLWSPGVKTGVKPGSFFHLTECFGPVLGLMRADSLDHAIELQNAVDYGLTAGIHSLDTAEVETWLDRVDAGNLYVNRSITGAIVERQPFGGWKKSTVGLGSKAGGPNYLMMLGAWTDGAAATSAWVDRALESDREAWDTQFGVAHDPNGFESEANILRYRPCPVVLRVGAGAGTPGAAGAAGAAGETAEVTAGLEAQMRRCALAAARVGAPIEWSVDEDVFPQVKGVIEELRAGVDDGVMAPEVDVSDAATFAARLDAVSDPMGVRVRMIGDVPQELVEAAARHINVTLIAEPVTVSGRVEQRYYVREQAVSMTMHRFGNADRDFQELAKRLR